MTTSSDFNLLRLEACRNLLQITDGTNPEEEVIELANTATWVRALVRQQRQAESDLKQLVDLCGTTINRAYQ